MKRNFCYVALGAMFGIAALCGCAPAGGDGPSGNDPADEVVYNIKTADLPFRDICVLADKPSKTYYMVGFIKTASAAQEVACYQSKDLENWGGYTTAMYNDGVWDQNWAAEIHTYKGGYYMFANLKGHANSGDLRGCYILKADKPNGVYETYSTRITPENWECLDGTLYVEDGIPYMVYCREWTRMPDGNGEMYLVRLKDDLSGAYPGAEHTKLFSARDNTLSADGVTDGPFLYNAKNGDLIMLWSKYINGKYAILTARSKSGKIAGPWTHDDRALFTNDGGHAMVFTDFDGNLRIAFHENSGNKGYERPAVYFLRDSNGALVITK